MENDWEKLANKFDDKDWSFSSSLAWKKVVDTNPLPFNLIQYSDQLRLSGNYIEAKKIIDNIEFEKIPDKYKFVYHIRKGMIQDDQGEITEAIESFKNAVELKPDETYPYIFLSSVLSKKSKLEEVEKVLKIALEKNGDIDEVNYNLSLNYARKGNFKSAIKIMKECLKLDPNFPNANTWLNDFINMENELIEK